MVVLLSKHAFFILLNVQYIFDVNKIVNIWKQIHFQGNYIRKCCAILYISIPKDFQIFIILLVPLFVNIRKIKKGKI